MRPLATMGVARRLAPKVSGTFTSITISYGPKPEDANTGAIYTGYKILYDDGYNGRFNEVLVSQTSQTQCPAPLRLPRSSGAKHRQTDPDISKDCRGTKSVFRTYSEICRCLFLVRSLPEFSM